MEAEHPINLPWNTAKNGMDEDSAAYKTIFQYMADMMRSVIDFLNELHNEAGDYQNERISETPLQAALDEAKVLSLHEIDSDKLELEEKFIAPEPAKPQQIAPDIEWIRYNVPVERYDAARKYFGVERPGELGLRTFEYFYNREIENDE